MGWRDKLLLGLTVLDVGFIIYMVADITRMVIYLRRSGR